MTPASWPVAMMLAMLTSLDLPEPAIGASKACRGDVSNPGSRDERQRKRDRDGAVNFRLEAERVVEPLERVSAAFTSALVGLAGTGGKDTPRGS